MPRRWTGSKPPFGVPVITALASTEAGTIAHQGLPPAPRVRGSVGPLVGCEVRLADVAGRVVAPGEIGEVQVRGAQVFDGYFDDAELNAASFVDGWFRMGDLARFDAAGELHLVGRIKEQINRGGEKISPAEIDAVLRSLPGIADAGAFPVPHPRLGEEVAGGWQRRLVPPLRARGGDARPERGPPAPRGRQDAGGPLQVHVQLGERGGGGRRRCDVL